MKTYIVRRLLLMIPTLFFVTVAVFLIIRLIPGAAVEQMVMQHQERTPGQFQATIEAVKHRLGLDLPIHVQYTRWVLGVIRADFGNSLWSERSVREEIIKRLPVSLELGLLAIVIALLIALPIGVYAAVRQDSIGDYIGRGLSIAALSIPGFWIATMIMVFPSIWWHWSPPSQYIPFTKDPLGNLEQFLIPAFIMGMGMAGITMRILRTTMLDVLRQDYIRTAWSKGITERVVVTKHALKNALIPVITVITGQVPIVIGGSFIIEQIFSLPGMGRLFLTALSNRDYPYISAINLIIATAVLLIILLTDLTYAYLDPRIRYR